MYKPYPYQQKEIDKICDFIENDSKSKPVFVLPVGAGKSIIVAQVALRFPNKYFINIAPSKELIAQNYDKYISYGYEASICSASLGLNEVSQVTFATIGTLKKHTKFFKDKEVVMIADECHSGSLKKSLLGKFLKELNNCTLIGVTATPMRLNATASGTKLSMLNRQRDCLYTKIASVVQVSEVVKEDKWSKLIYDVEDVDETKLELNTAGSDYTLKSLAAFSDANNIKDKCVEAVYKLREEGRKSCIVYVTSIEEAESVASKIGDAEVLHSKLKKDIRDKVITDFTSGKLKTIINIGILKMGFDYPELSSIVLARPTNSYTLYSQIIGRAVRIHKNKKDAKIVDISGNYNKFGAIEELEFVNEKYTGGWAAFSGEKLLTGYALGSSLVPTKESLKEHLARDDSYENKDPRFNFGKHKGMRVSYVKQRHEGYLAWITAPETNFTFRGEQGLAIKKAIYHQLKLPMNKFNRMLSESKK